MLMLQHEWQRQNTVCWTLADASSDLVWLEQAMEEASAVLHVHGAHAV